MEPEFQIAARDLRFPLDIAEQFEASTIPQHHAAGAVVAGRDIALEVAVGNRVILHVRGQMLHRWIERRPFRNRPGLQHAINLKPEIVVQARGIVSLYTEVMAGHLGLIRPRLGRL